MAGRADATTAPAATVRTARTVDVLGNPLRDHAVAAPKASTATTSIVAWAAAGRLPHATADPTTMALSNSTAPEPCRRSETGQERGSGTDDGGGVGGAGRAASNQPAALRRATCISVRRSWACACAVSACARSSSARSCACANCSSRLCARSHHREPCSTSAVPNRPPQLGQTDSATSSGISPSTAEQYGHHMRNPPRCHCRRLQYWAALRV